MAKSNNKIIAEGRGKSVLIGSLLGALFVVAALIALWFFVPSQDEIPEDSNYGYVYSGAKSESIPFAMNSVPKDAVLVFGSSELATSKNVVREVPLTVFGENDTGVNLQLIGEAFDQSLWQAIAAGAYGSTDAQRKIVLIISPTWFADEGQDVETFKLKFSYPLFKRFYANPNISTKNKDYVVERLLQMGISTTEVDAAMLKGVTGILNDVVFSYIKDIQARFALMDIRSEGINYKYANGEQISGSAQGRDDEEMSGNDDQLVVPLDSNGNIDFDALMFEAEVDSVIESTNNTWGMDDDFYTKNIEGRLDELKDSQKGEKFSNETEFRDFEMLLAICKEVGFEPLVIISPVHGGFYDYVGTLEEDRSRTYERIRKICESEDVEIADFSDKEYENYFLHDIVHFGWTGWVSVEEAIYNYVRG